MGSHTVTCYPTQVNTPRLNSNHVRPVLIYLPRRDGRLSWPSSLDSALAESRTSDLSITSPTLNQCNHQNSQGIKRYRRIKTSKTIKIINEVKTIKRTPAPPFPLASFSLAAPQYFHKSAHICTTTDCYMFSLDQWSHVTPLAYISFVKMNTEFITHLRLESRIAE